jgi:hypothetical protein
MPVFNSVHLNEGNYNVRRHENTHNVECMHVGAEVQPWQ